MDIYYIQNRRQLEPRISRPGNGSPCRIDLNPGKGNVCQGNDRKVTNAAKPSQLPMPVTGESASTLWILLAAAGIILVGTRFVFKRH